GMCRRGEKEGGGGGGGRGGGRGPPPATKGADLVKSACGNASRQSSTEGDRGESGLSAGDLARSEAEGPRRRSHRPRGSRRGSSGGPRRRCRCGSRNGSARRSHSPSRPPGR